jgi:hypothetical protein
MSDRELEEQIEELITKATRDLKVRVLRVVAKHTTKLLKEQAREIKGGGRTREPAKSTRDVKGRDRTEREHTTRETRPVKKPQDDDSDEYYSE